MSPSAPATLVEMFARRVEASGDKQALWLWRGDAFAPLTWNELADEVRRAAAAFARLGVEPGDRIVQVSENRHEWIVADLAIQMAAAVHVPVHAPLSGAQIAYQIRDSGAKVVLVSGPGQADKLPPVAADLPDDLTLLSYDPCPPRLGPWSVGSWRDFVGAEGDAAGQRIQDRGLAIVKADDLATLIYTSGTTGEPKGVMLSQRNLVSNAQDTNAAFVVREDDRRLSWLPLSHIFARTCDLIMWIDAGNELAVARSRDTIIADCQAAQPTILNGVPYFYDKVCRALTEQGLADVPGAVRKYLGGRVRICCSGGAALPDHVAEFFRRQGVLLLQGYGLTETSPVLAVGTETDHRPSSVGKILPGAEVRIAADGEVLARGRYIMSGYWNKPQATAEALRDGWFHTGDLGQFDADGYLKITGRKKELIVTAAGKNIAPIALEALLGEDPLVSQAIIVGEGRKFLTALIVPDRAAVEAELARRGLPCPKTTDWLTDAAVRNLFARRIKERLSQVAAYEQVQKFALLDRSFSIESGELTPTLKLRRGVIETHYAEAIQSLYD